jgi:hypothetical protein
MMVRHLVILSIAWVLWLLAALYLSYSRQLPDAQPLFVQSAMPTYGAANANTPYQTCEPPRVPPFLVRPYAKRIV